MLKCCVSLRPSRMLSPALLATDSRTVFKFSVAGILLLPTHIRLEASLRNWSRTKDEALVCPILCTPKCICHQTSTELRWLRHQAQALMTRKAWSVSMQKNSLSKVELSQQIAPPETTLLLILTILILTWLKVISSLPYRLASGIDAT